MVFVINGFQFAHVERAFEDRCLVYSRVGLVGRVLVNNTVGMLWFVRGRYVMELEVV